MGLAILFLVILGVHGGAATSIDNVRWIVHDHWWHCTKDPLYPWCVAEVSRDARKIQGLEVVHLFHLRRGTVDVHERKLCDLYEKTVRCAEDVGRDCLNLYLDSTAGVDFFDERGGRLSLGRCVPGLGKARVSRDIDWGAAEP